MKIKANFTAKMDLESLRFPIGKFQAPDTYSSDTIESYIQTIESFPHKLEVEVKHLSESQLDTPYRPNGWTIRQVINHCADSHINALIRFKLALTEENPTIKPYMEAKWAELADSKQMSIEPALLMLKGTHERLAIILRSMTVKDLKRTFIHPEHDKVVSLDENIGLYAWHCEHHLAHITSLKKRKGWK